VDLLTTPVGVGETLAEAPVDRADHVGLLHGGSRQQRNTFRLGEAKGKQKLAVKPGEPLKACYLK
jgi:hypothetical protein